MFYYKLLKKNNFPVVCNIPHSSIKIPKKFRKDFLIDNDELDFFVKIMSDLHTDYLYYPLIKKYGGILSDISRVVVDVERFKNDCDEIMSKVGMGVLYMKNGDGKIIRKLSKFQKDEYIKEVYDVYHNVFTELVEKTYNKFGKCFIIDCHSFPSLPRSYDFCQKENRPDICIGTDFFHTPKVLVNNLIKKFEENNFTVKENEPFSGTILPLKFYNKKNIYSIMIEVNRSLYMNEDSFEKNKDFKNISKVICDIIDNEISVFYE